MEERTDENRLKRWIFLDANRWSIIAALLTVVFGVLVLLTAVSPAPITILFKSQSAVEFAFSALVTGIITGVTLVLTINQLIVSQELGPLGQQRDRMEGAMTFRQDIEEATALAVSPTEPPTFFRALIESTRRQATEIEDALDDATDQEAREDIEAYLDDLTENAADVSDQLQGAQFGNFRLLDAALDYDYSRKIHSARKIQTTHHRSLSDAVLDSLDDLIRILKFVGPAREHFKTFYFQWELINLSYAILYTSIPALLVSFAMILFFDPGFVSGTILGTNTVLVVVCAAVTIGIIPFVVLFAYILRIATVAKRTLAVGPFTLFASEGSEDIQWEDD